MSNTPQPAPLAELSLILGRAVSDRPVPPDDFALDQSALRDLTDANDAERDAWLSSLTLHEARFVLAQLDTVANEHRRRASTAEANIEWIRAGLQHTANDGRVLPGVPPMVPGGNRATS